MCTYYVYMHRKKTPCHVAVVVTWYVGYVSVIEGSLARCVSVTQLA